MENIKPDTFLLPVGAAAVASIFYVYFLGKAVDKKAFHRFFFIMAMIAFVLNFTWELIQLPLYKDAVYNFDHIAFCSLASAVDAVMVLLLYFATAFLFRNLFWMQDLKWPQVVLVITAGGVGAILSEMRELSLGTWAYAAPMPLVPLVRAGLSPVLQFMVLPFLIYFLSLRGSTMTRRKNPEYFSS